MRNLAEHPVTILIVLGLFAVLFGGKRLPEAARGLGRSLRIFKSEVKQMQEDDKPSTPTPPVEGRIMHDADGRPSTADVPVADPLLDERRDSRA